MLYRNKIPKVSGEDDYSVSTAYQDNYSNRRHERLAPINHKVQRMGTHAYIDSIYNQNKHFSLPVDKIIDEDWQVRRARDSEKIVLNRVVDLRRNSKERDHSTCQVAGCLLCQRQGQGQASEEFYETSRKSRFKSLPSYQYTEKWRQRHEPTTSLSNYKNYPTRKPSSVVPRERSYLFDPRFISSQSESPTKPARLRTIETRELPQFRTSYYEEKKINGRVYLVRKTRNPKLLTVKSKKQRKTISPQSQKSSNRESESEKEISVIQEAEARRLKKIQSKASKQQQRRRQKVNQLNKKMQKKVQEQLKLKIQEDFSKMVKLQTYFQEMEENNAAEFLKPIKRTRLHTMNQDGLTDQLDSHIFYRNNMHKRSRIKNRLEDPTYAEEDIEGEKELYKVKFPSLAEIDESINNYKPLTKLIDTFYLTKQPTYMRQYYDEKGKQYLYFGEFDKKRNRRVGRGVLVTKKRVLEGIWEDDFIIEGGQLKPKGIYRGFFEKGLKNGQGVYESVNGDTYLGTWKQGKRNGKGHWKSSQGQTYSGNWIMGRATGKGELSSPEDGTYKGDFLNFVKHGRGVYDMPNGDQYIGDFCEGVPEGQGKYIWKCGLVYSGSFRQAVREGKGTLRKQGLFILEGTFRNDLPDGLCKVKIEGEEQEKIKYVMGDRSGALQKVLKTAQDLKTQNSESKELMKRELEKMLEKMMLLNRR